MSALQRPRVIWWGTHPPADIARELQHRELELFVSEDEATVMGREVRALLLPHRWRKGAGALRARANRLLGPLADRGGRLVVVAFGEAERQLSVTQLPTLANVIVLDGTAANVVAEACVRWAPGPFPGTVEVAVPRKNVITSQDELLLRRAFSEFRRLDVHPLSGGLSPASVWRVEATDSSGRSPQPFLVKAGSEVEITAEIATTRDFVLDHMPFTNRPPLLIDRCVSGLDRRLLVSMCVERSERLDAYLARGGTPEPVVPSIFEGPLRCWRANRRSGELALGLVYEQRVRGARDPNTGRRRKDSDLAEAYRLALTVDKTIPLPEVVLEIVARYPKRVTVTCQAHGDLHPRNVFVRDNSGEIVLIDFGKSGGLGNPVALDASTLDVALAFDGWDAAGTAVSLSEITALYVPPLFTSTSAALSPRGKAIQILRRHAHHDSADDSEYTIAIVAGLLRASRLLAKAKGPEAQRATLIVTALRAAGALATTLPQQS